MKKVKKILASFCILMMGWISKVMAQNVIESKYGVVTLLREEMTMGEKIASAGRIAIPIILAVIGIVVLFNEKMTAKAKAIGILVLILGAIISIALLNTIANNG